MSSTVFNLRSYVNGDAIDLDTIKFQDSTGTYGLKRTDTGATVIASGVDWTRLSEGNYQHVLTDPAPNLIYDYVIRITYAAGFSGPRYYQRSVESDTTVSHIFTVPESSTYYSSEAEVLRFIGELAGDLMTEDWEQADKSQVWGDILSYVDETVDSILGHKYDRADILGNSFVRRRATILAAHLLTTRRGNPPIYQRAHDQILEEFRDVIGGNALLPRATPFARNAPVIRNYMMQPFGYHPQRIIQTKSTGGSYASMDVAYEPYLVRFPI